MNTTVDPFEQKVHRISEAVEAAWPFNIKVSSPTLLKSPGSCSSHVVNTSCPESAHPPVLLLWHFQENPSRLEACRINSRDRGWWWWGGGDGECCADLTAFIYRCTLQNRPGPKCLQHPPLSQSVDDGISAYQILKPLQFTLRLLPFFPQHTSNTSLHHSPW